MDKPELAVHKAGMTELNNLLTIRFELDGILMTWDDMQPEEQKELLSSLSLRLQREHEAFTSLVLMFSSLAHAIKLGKGEIFLDQILSSLEKWY